MDAANFPEFRLLLYRHAATAWNDVLRPWLEETRGELTRSYIVVATRGQAHGIKQRCLMDGVPLLGVEFLTPGLARKKWFPLHQRENAPDVRPAMGRELLLLGLQAGIQKRLRNLSPENPEWGFWQSLQSDPERALDDFDDLLKAGFRPADFHLEPLAEVFGELMQWSDTLGYDLAPIQSEIAALTALPPDAQRLGDRLLVYGLSAELWSEFSNVAALSRRFPRVTVVLPEPEFRGQKQLDENWVELWQALLGVTALPLADPEGIPSCEEVGARWNPAVRAQPVGNTSVPARVLVGHTRRDEMLLVADETEAALQRGAEHIGVILDGPGAAHSLLSAELHRRGIQFRNTIDAPAAVPLELNLQRQLAEFYARGARLDEVLELWPYLRASGQTSLTLRQVRAFCDRLFDLKQAHALAAYSEALAGAKSVEGREVYRVLSLLLPPFPPEATIKQVLSRFAEVCEQVGLPPPLVGALHGIGEKDPALYPSALILKAIGTLLPTTGRAVVPGETNFARVTLLTRRRAEGLTFSHLFLTQANAGVWPSTNEGSPWLPDDVRKRLNQSSRFSLGLFTSEDWRVLERHGFLQLARDTSEEVVFFASLYEEQKPETKLGPNSWAERVLWSDATLRDSGCSFEEQFERLAVARADKPSPEARENTAPWAEVWRARRRPDHPFDAHFLCVDPERVRPDAVSARALERAVADPAELWFAEVLGAAQVDWRPFVRARRKAIGQWVHRTLAWALQPEGPPQRIGRRRPRHEVESRLVQRLGQLRAEWPRNHYWESFHLELERSCRQLLEAVYSIPGGEFVATELTLPHEATVPIGQQERLRVRGRVDLAFFDRPEWNGAGVEIVDFKTGSDAGLSSERMARDGFGLQLGIYLSAAQSLGVSNGRVWMLKPELNAFSSLDLTELPAALVLLEKVGMHLRTGKYGALTEDASDYAPEGFRWPVACVPIAREILEAKHALTFGLAGEEGGT